MNRGDSRRHAIGITVNGREVHAAVEGRMLLIDFLRRHADVTGPGFGCEEGACGACTVQLDGATVKSCLVLAVQADGQHVLTADGLATRERLAPVQQAFIDCNAAQCGYCTAGMVMSAEHFLRTRAPGPLDDAALRRALTGNLCRCTGYSSVLQAVALAAGEGSATAERADVPHAGPWVGRPLARREDPRLVSGGGRYVDAYGEAADLHLAVVRATRARALIAAIDVAAARAAPGVALVMTGAEAREHWQPIAPTSVGESIRLPRRYALAIDEVAFYGEPVAIVVADTPEAAEDAAAQVRVDYSELPPVVDMHAALAPDAPLVYPEWGTNLQTEFALEFGEVDASLDNAAHVIEQTISSHRFGAMPLETRATHARFDPRDGTLTVRASTQVPHQLRMFLSQVFGLAESRIQVLAGDVGGAFGAKLGVDGEYLAVLAALQLGRPVKWIETRAGWIHGGPGARDFEARCQAAFDCDGRLLALTTDILADMGCDGAERACGIGMPINGGVYAPGPYRVANYRSRVRCVVTNKGPYGAYRGYGKDVANLIIERLLDRAAVRLNIDPLEIRRRNLLEAYPYQLVTGPIIENGSLRESQARLAAMMDLPALRRRQAAARAAGRHLGIGVANYIEPCGVAFPASVYQNFESATLRLAADGSVHVLTAIQNIGQGIETAYAQATADALGCDLADITVSWGDTNAMPIGSGTYASRGAMFAVGAIVQAAETLRARLLCGAAVLLECPQAELDIADGRIWRRGHDASISFRDIARAVYMGVGAEIVLAEADAPVLETTSTFRNPHINWQPDAQGRVQLYPGHATGSQAALVEVDPETGRVDVLDVWLVSDHGVVLNPLILDGQTRGAVVQQIGGTIYESLAYDEAGIPLASTLKDYGMPTVWAAPEIHIEHLCSPSPATRTGAKGGGEDGCIATSTVLMAAVEDALQPWGVEVTHSRLDPQTVRRLVAAAEFAGGEPI
jgi:carbon-monoxide dehydrogenase large subunit